MLSKLNFKRYALVIDVLFLLALAAYAWVGVRITPFHGDEGMQIYATRDYFTAFVDGESQTLITQPPYYIDSRPYLRLINGSVQRYVTGFVLHQQGKSPADFQLEPGWNWGLSYEENVAASWLPSDTILMPGRYVSVSFFIMSMVALFTLGYLLGGRAVAYPATFLYALNPILLLNSRRAMMEGSMLAFGLLTLLIAAWIVTRSKCRVCWLLLPIVGGLTLASKHSGGLFLAGAWGWIFVVSLFSKQWIVIGKRTAQLIISGILAIAIFVGLSPALWHQPLARLGDLTHTRAELLAIQVSIDNDAPTTISKRLQALIVQPFMTPEGYYEMASWERAEAIHDEIAVYTTSGLAGIPNNIWLGGVLTVLALWGSVSLVQQSNGNPHTRMMMIGMGLWLALTGMALMGNPLPWQRYYIPLIPIYALLAGYGIGGRLSTNSNIKSVATDGKLNQT